VEIIEIRDLEDDRLSLFYDVAKTVYRSDPVWAPASETIVTQRFLSSELGKGRVVLVVAVENGQALARGAAIRATKSLEQAEQVQGYLGFFECVEGRSDAGQSVLRWCERSLVRLGATRVLAPKVDNQLAGLLVSGFELPHMFLTNHNPPHYLPLFLDRGYSVQSRICTFHFARETTPVPDVHLEGFSTRVFDRTKLEEEILIFHNLQRAIFEQTPDYVPRTLEEDSALVESMLPYLQDDLVLFAEDSAGNPVGLVVCLPDMYQAFQGQRIDRVRVVTVGAIPRLTHKGIGALLGAQLMKNIVRRGDISFCEGSIVLKSNLPPQNLAKRFRAKPGREFVLLDKAL
jgi:hypothetical protein